LSSRISLLESAVLDKESEDQFSKIHNKITTIEVDRAKMQSDTLAKIDKQQADFDQLNFYFQNYKTDLASMHGTVDTLHKHFEKLDLDLTERFIDTKTEIKEGFHRDLKRYEEANSRQSSIQDQMDRRFKQLDDQKTKIDEIDQFIANLSDDVGL